MTKSIHSRVSALLRFSFPRSSGNSMFSYTSSTGMRLNDWKMKPRVLWRRAVSCLSLSELVSVPLILTTPEVGVSMQPIIFRMVDLPEPDGPVIEMNSPFSTAKETPRTACTSVFPKGYTFVTSISSTTACRSPSTVRPPGICRSLTVATLSTPIFLVAHLQLARPVCSSRHCVPERRHCLGRERGHDQDSPLHEGFSSMLLP